VQKRKKIKRKRGAESGKTRFASTFTYFNLLHCKNTIDKLFAFGYGIRSMDRKESGERTWSEEGRAMRRESEERVNLEGI